jgi:hypothetical protein
MAEKPPCTATTCPVMNAAAGDARNAMRPARPARRCKLFNGDHVIKVEVSGNPSRAVDITAGAPAEASFSYSVIWYPATTTVCCAHVGTSATRAALMLCILGRLLVVRAVPAGARAAL